MRSVVQRVTQARVSVEGETIGAIGPGLLVLLGVAHADSDSDADWMAEKITGLRIFADDQGKMNRSLHDTGGAMLAVSQFTLLGDCRKGKRPSYVGAAAPEHAERLYQRFIASVRTAGIELSTGRFRADMQVELVNDGPVTLVIDSAAKAAGLANRG